MSNLVKSTSVIIPKEVSHKSRIVYQANTSVMIKNVEDKNIVVNSIHQAVNRSIADKGVNMDVEDMNYLKRSITDDILRDFPTLTMQDISLCFSMGVRGNLGEYYGINVVSLYGWLKKYKEEVLPEAIGEVRRYLPPAELEEPKVDHKQLDLDKVENICSAIDLYTKDGIYEFNDFGNIHYKFLNRHSVFNFSDELINSKKEDARIKFISDLKNKNLELLGQGKSFQMVSINSLMDKIEHGDKDVETLIDILHLKLLLKHFIVNFSKKQKDLEEFKKNLIIKVEEHYGK
jgi:hypothetical protein